MLGIFGILIQLIVESQWSPTTATGTTMLLRGLSSSPQKEIYQLLQIKFVWSFKIREINFKFAGKCSWTSIGLGKLGYPGAVVLHLLSRNSNWETLVYLNEFESHLQPECYESEEFKPGIMNGLSLWMLHKNRLERFDKHTALKWTKNYNKVSDMYT